jgi:hypothetical protein
VILLYQRRDPLGSLPDQLLLDLSHQRTGYPVSPEIRMDSQPVDVTTPTVERPNDRAKQPSSGLCHEDMRWAVGDGPPQIIGIVGYADCGVGLPPQFKNAFYIF